MVERLQAGHHRFAAARLAAQDDAGTRATAFIPFSAGARRCIGEYFSIVEMQMHLAILAPRYRLEPAGELATGGMPALDPAVNLRTRDPILMTLGLR